jgi:hypothetical protein
MSDRQEAAYRVLAKRRFFDPVQFVEACRSLNLNFNVYHQNDATGSLTSCWIASRR